MRIKFLFLLILLGWGGLSFLPVVLGETVECARRVEAFDCRNPSRQIGFFEPATDLEIEEYVTAAKMFRVCFRAPDGTEIRALCRPEALGKTPPGGNAVAGNKPAAAMSGVRTEVDLLLARFFGLDKKTVSSATGQFDVPAGSYEVSIYQVRKIMAGRQWTLVGSSLPGQYRKIKSTGEPVSLRLGEDLRICPQVSIGEGMVWINCRLRGSLNEEYRAAVVENGQVHAAPKFQVMDESGRVMASGQFEFG
ncbi:MAG: hypothetical protein PHV34_21665 [Verrucomicrobiae bacterium]|nr:hypothetical protein [Verrucomicrobiae bacterium]